MRRREGFSIAIVATLIFLASMTLFFATQVEFTSVSCPDILKP
jgi:hypothetical protein